MGNSSDQDQQELHTPPVELPGGTRATLHTDGDQVGVTFEWDLDPVPSHHDQPPPPNPLDDPVSRSIQRARDAEYGLPEEVHSPIPLPHHDEAPASEPGDYPTPDEYPSSDDSSDPDSQEAVAANEPESQDEEGTEDAEA